MKQSGRIPLTRLIPRCRREALGPILEDPSSVAAREAVAVELALTLRGLLENPKSYAAWHHRGWVVEHGAADLQQELALVHKCAMFLPHSRL